MPAAVSYLYPPSLRSCSSRNGCSASSTRDCFDLPVLRWRYSSCFPSSLSTLTLSWIRGSFSGMSRHVTGDTFPVFAPAIKRSTAAGSVGPGGRGDPRLTGMGYHLPVKTHVLSTCFAVAAGQLGNRQPLRVRPAKSSPANEGHH